MRKDFQLHFHGEVEDMAVLLEGAKAFLGGLRDAGAEVEAHFGSGHLLGGFKNLDEVHEDNPARFADGTVHPVPQEAPVDPNV